MQTFGKEGCESIIADGSEIGHLTYQDQYRAKFKTISKMHFREWELLDSFTEKCPHVSKWHEFSIV